MAVSGTPTTRPFLRCCLVAFALLFALPVSALDSRKAINQYVHKVWDMEAGLPQNSVKAIVQTGDLYLWLATEEGLVRFDGRQFTTFNKVNTEVMSDHHIIRLLEDSRGRLWIGCWDGLLLYYENGVFHKALRDQSVAPLRIHAIHEDSQGKIWIGSVKGLLQYQDGKLAPYDFGTEHPGLKIFSFSNDSQGNLWAGSNQGLLRLGADGTRFFTTDDGLPSNLVREVHVDSHGRLWSGTYGGGIALYAGDGFQVFTTSDGLPGNSINVIREDRDGNLWIGTSDSGICRYSQGVFSTFATADGLSNDYIEAILEDADGNLWVGTSGGGLNHLIDGKLTTIFGTENLTNDVVFSIFEDRDGGLWAGTMAGLTCLKAGRVDQYTTDNGLVDNLVLTLAGDREGNIWIGTRGGLQRFREGRFNTLTNADGLTDDLVTALAQAPDGSIWIGTGAGINRYADGEITLLSGDEAFIACRVIHPDQDGRIWVGTRTRGILVLGSNGSRLEIHDETNGLANNHVLDIHEDSRGVFWVASVGGITRIRGGDRSTITIKDGLFCDEVFRILEDGEGRFWMSGNKGIFYVEKSELDKVADGWTGQVTSHVFDKSDGMLSNECNGVAQPAGWRTHEGKMYFPTIKGMVAFDPSAIDRREKPPPVVVEGITIDDAPIPLSEEMTVPPGSHRLEIHYTALSFQAPHRDRFRYRLEGFDQHWKDAGSSRIAIYTEIPPGRYRFRLTASRQSEPADQECTAFTLNFEPRFYETSLFAISAVLALILLIFAGHRVRARHHARREEMLSALVDERTKKLKQEIDEHERTQKTLAEEQKRLSTTLESIGEGIITTDLHGKIILMNGVAERFTGWKTEDALGRPANEILTITREEDGQPLENVVDRVLGSGQIVDPSSANLLIDRKGGVRQIAYIAAPIIDDDQQLQGVVLVLIDATDKRKMEQERLKISKLESVALLAGGIAHDFNNILTGILGNVSLLGMWLNGDTQVADCLTETQLACRRASELTQQLLTFAKGGSPVKKAVAIEKLIREHANFAVSGSNVSCDLKIANDLSSAEADPSQLGQVVHNLVINGVQAMPGGGTITIMAENLEYEQDETSSVLTLESGRYLKISFIDHGAGIANDILPNIFDPYFTTREGGSGLGLAIAYSIIRKHNGHLLADSTPGQGATFTIYLPATDLKPLPEPKPQPRAPTGCGRILVMDDENLICALVKKSLASLGYEAQTASDGTEALQLFQAALDQERPFDIVILDLTVPGGMGGVEALGRLRKIDPSVKAIVSSGYFNDPVLANYREYHFQGVLHKPFAAADLAESLHRILSPAGGEIG